MLPRVGRTAETIAAMLGPFLATYTAVLVSDTAVPAWHDARRELPFVFAASAAGSAGAAAAMLTPVADARPARRFTLGGAVVSLVALEMMQRRRGVTMEPYRSGPAGRLSAWARALTATGAAVTTVVGRRRRSAAVLGGAVVLAGAVCERFAVLRAGSQSAQDPAYTVGAQLARSICRADVDGA